MEILGRWEATKCWKSAHTRRAPALHNSAFAGRAFDNSALGAHDDGRLPGFALGSAGVSHVFRLGALRVRLGARSDAFSRPRMGFCRGCAHWLDCRNRMLVDMIGQFTLEQDRVIVERNDSALELQTVDQEDGDRAALFRELGQKAELRRAYRLAARPFGGAGFFRAGFLHSWFARLAVESPESAGFRRRGL